MPACYGSTIKGNNSSISGKGIILSGPSAQGSEKIINDYSGIQLSTVTEPEGHGADLQLPSQ